MKIKFNGHDTVGGDYRIVVRSYIYPGFVQPENSAGRGTARCYSISTCTIQPKFLVSLSIALLQVFLERRRRRDRFTRILVILRVGVAGIGHAALANVLEDGRGAAELGGRGESGGRGHKGSDDGDLVLQWMMCAQTKN